LFLLGRVLKILAYQSRQKFAEMTRLRAAAPKIFAHRGRHGDQDGQAEQAARQANDQMTKANRPPTCAIALSIIY
jgi:hypothetical protein